MTIKEREAGRAVLKRAKAGADGKLLISEAAARFSALLNMKYFEPDKYKLAIVWLEDNNYTVDEDTGTVRRE